MKKSTVYVLLLACCIIGFWLFENFYTPATYSTADKSDLDFPIEILPESTTHQIVKHQYYMLSYSEPHEQAEWVIYPLIKDHLTNDDRKRPFFIEDPKVKSKSADWRNYKGSGYDRGHLCPAGDRRFSEYAYNETFYTSNIAPQNREFNAGIWNQLEQKIRYWCKRYGDLYIITGGVLENRLIEIGDEGVDVPLYFYKMVIRPEGNQFETLAFLIPNQESQKSLQEFLVPIDSIEKLTGIDFFEQMPDTQEAALEKEVQKSNWKF